jgi:hypothetical protein
MKDKFYQLGLWIVIVTILLAICIVQFSCMTNQKATRQANNIIEKKPLIILSIFREKFPCVTTKLDTNIIWKDTTINIDCPEVNQPIQSGEYFVIRDTFKVFKTIKVPVTLPVQIREITKTVMDSSYGKEQSIKLNKITVKAESLQIDKDWLEKGRNRWRLWFMLLAAFNIIWFFGKSFLRLLKFSV